MIDSLLTFAAQFESILVTIGIVSGVVFVATLVFTPYLLGRIPQDYFAGQPKANHSHFLVNILKNTLGFVLLIAGVIMLVTPGQGVVSILLGLFLVQFPGKRKLEVRLIHHDGTFKTLNWLRAKANKPPFKR